MVGRWFQRIVKTDKELKYLQNKDRIEKFYEDMSEHSETMERLEAIRE